MTANGGTTEHAFASSTRNTRASLASPQNGLLCQQTSLVSLAGLTLFGHGDVAPAHTSPIAVWLSVALNGRVLLRLLLLPRSNHAAYTTSGLCTVRIAPVCVAYRSPTLGEV